MQVVLEYARSGICVTNCERQWQIQGKGIAADSAMTTKLESAVQELETREKGVDLCVLMDGTGSMVSIL